MVEAGHSKRVDLCAEDETYVAIKRTAERNHFHVSDVVRDTNNRRLGAPDPVRGDLTYRPNAIFMILCPLDVLGASSHPVWPQSMAMMSPHRR